ncbi:unnamed protein product [Echinostoma caproni]|uniref:Uncharacterized protein n=1 Tax=Echinostoma caproni TaxID=27848 RepID=A0A183A7K0_9TREM|nr:unnamed protein product [Echinostoma caproni]
MLTLKDHFSAVDGNLADQTSRDSTVNCHSPPGSMNESWSSSLMTTESIASDEQLTERAKHLKLYSFPHLLQTTKSSIEKEADKLASRIRQLSGRRNFARLERERVRVKREILEDSLTSRRIKDLVEKRVREQKDTQSADHIGISVEKSDAPVTESTSTAITPKSSVMVEDAGGCGEYQEELSMSNSSTDDEDSESSE